MTNEKKAKVLDEMRNILSSSARWTKGELARDASGASVGVSSPDASCFCVIGAYKLARYRVSGGSPNFFLDDWFIARHHLRLPGWGGQISGWNDYPTTTYEDVLEFLTD